MATLVLNTPPDVQGEKDITDAIIRRIRFQCVKFHNAHVNLSTLKTWMDNTSCGFGIRRCLDSDIEDLRRLMNVYKRYRRETLLPVGTPVVLQDQLDQLIDEVVGATHAQEDRPKLVQAAVNALYNFSASAHAAHDKEAK